MKQLPPLITAASIERTRQKFLKLVDGHGPNIYYGHQIYRLVHTEPVLDYLLSQELTGKKLDEWVQEKHAGSILTAISYVVSEINRTRQRPLRLGVEYAK